MRKWSLNPYYPYFEMRSLAGGVPRTANLKLKTDIKNNPQCSKKSEVQLIVNCETPAILPNQSR